MRKRGTATAGPMMAALLDEELSPPETHVRAELYVGTTKPLRGRAGMQGAAM
jgi:hypothetical protein